MKTLLFSSAVLLSAIFSTVGNAAVKLPSVFTSNMVLQRDKPIAIWGWADPEEKVEISFAGTKSLVDTTKEGKWFAELPAQKANATGQNLTIKASNTIELSDILIGDVWIGSGQSNMEWSLNASASPKETIAGANHPTIRLFHVPKVQAKEPANSINATWKICTPQNIPNFSAVLYHFGVRLQKDLDIPVGLINSSWGGSRIEPWTVTSSGSGGMYNGMIAPLVPLTFKGVIWYQGESNVSEGMKYYERKKALIEGWRTVFKNDMPFYFVQIAPWANYQPGKLPELWEAQVASLKIPGTGMAVTTDLVDNIKDIHPKNKFDVGNRLALWALAKTYGKKDLVYSGPLFQSAKADGAKMVLSFAHVADGLKSRDGKELSDFEIAGDDGVFVPATAEIVGKTVVVSSEKVKAPSQVRFGWSNTCNPNLINSAGLPASPFRTKDWQGGTGE
ncbi:MAG: sialate O-acetylesterase [Zavarzinella sp.]